MVTIICPVYNAENYLNDCIESLIEQTYKNIEIILIDDDSSDRSLVICDEWALKDERIKVVHNTRGGVSKARNTGVRIANGKYLFFIDADDIIEPNTIEILLKYHDGKKSTITVSNYERFMDLPVKIKRESGKLNIKNYRKPSIKDFMSARQGGYIWGMLFTKDLIDEKEVTFNEEMHNLEDVTWIGSFIGYVEDMIFVDGVFYHYRRNPTSITSYSTDYRWQAKCWLQVKENFENRKAIDIRERNNFSMMNRYCKHNFYAEVFVGGLTYEQVRNIYKEVNGLHKMSRIEWLFYKIFFSLRKLLKI